MGVLCGRRRERGGGEGEEGEDEGEEGEGEGAPLEGGGCLPLQGGREVHPEDGVRLHLQGGREAHHEEAHPEDGGRLPLQGGREAHGEEAHHEDGGRLHLQGGREAHHEEAHLEDGDRLHLQGRREAHREEAHHKDGGRLHLQGGREAHLEDGACAHPEGREGISEVPGEGKVLTRVFLGNDSVLRGRIRRRGEGDGKEEGEGVHLEDGGGLHLQRGGGIPVVPRDRVVSTLIAIGKDLVHHGRIGRRRGGGGEADLEDGGCHLQGGSGGGREIPEAPGERVVPTRVVAGNDITRRVDRPAEGKGEREVEGGEGGEEDFLRTRFHGRCKGVSEEGPPDNAVPLDRRTGDRRSGLHRFSHTRFSSMMFLVFSYHVCMSLALLCFLTVSPICSRSLSDSQHLCSVLSCL